MKIREMSGEVEKKTLQKRWIIPQFYDGTWLIFETLCPHKIFEENIKKMRAISKESKNKSSLKMSPDSKNLQLNKKHL